MNNDKGYTQACYKPSTTKNIKHCNYDFVYNPLGIKLKCAISQIFFD